MALQEIPIINDQLDMLNHLIAHQNAAIDLLAADKRQELTTNLGLFAELVANDEVLEVMDYGDRVNLAWADGSNNYTLGFNLCHLENAILEDQETIKVADIETNYVLPFDLIFDELEAIVASDTDLPAGTYFFKIVNDSWGGNNGKVVQFTLSSPLVAGMQIRKRSGAYNAAIENCSLGIYASGEDTTGENLPFSVVESGASGATNLGQTDGQSYCNYWHCVVLGYNRWIYSALRQYLNSDKAAGNWWKQQHKWDVKPPYADTKDGFLKGFDASLLPYMKETQIKTCKNTVFAPGGEAGNFDISYDKVFLASLEQTYINPQLAGEGDYWEYYKRLLGRTTPAALYQSYNRLIKYDLAAVTTPRSRWLRSALRDFVNRMWTISVTGNINYYGTSSALRCAPCLRIGL